MTTRNTRIAVVGAGYWGKNLVRSFHRLGVLHSICDGSPTTRERMNDLYPEIPFESNFESILQNPEIDAVSLATPAAHHGEMVRAALLAGKDVLVEKPLCLSSKEAEELHKLALAQNRILMVGHLLWYHPAVLKLRSLVRDGALGKIRCAYSNRLNMGKIRQQENVLWSFAPHDISVILGLLEETPETVYTHAGDFITPGIVDTATTSLSFASGVRAHIFVSWLHPFKEQKLVLVGDQQMAVFDDTLPWEQKLCLYPHTVTPDEGGVPTANKADAQYVPLEAHEPLLAECEHFLDCVSNRTSPRTDGEEATEVLKVLNACEESMKNKQPASLKAPSNYFVHDSSFVDEGTQIGEGTKIWHFSHVLKNAIIGKQCNIGQNVVISSNCVIGDGCKIQNNVSIYEGVELEQDVFCGPSMVFTNVTNPRSHVIRKHEYKKTLVKQGASIGANSTIVCGNTLGRYSFIGAGAVVTRDVPSYALVVGNPAKRIGWMCACGERLPQDLTCQTCETRYRENENQLEPLQ